ncbi:diguanylate cyclase [Rhizobium sp.]|jgi:diguanylate cyclase (GGDEF)-like protein|uniref:diguanylate cyclase domain-containing protein n=1 Tax=Rhizobium sp. TaxID=391 RepID=UPI000E812DBD|nr:hypothetical protein [Rhizobium sp.]
MSDNNTTDLTTEAGPHSAIMKAFDHMPIAVGLFDKAGRFLYMNSMFRQLHCGDDAGLKIESFADLRKAGMFRGWEVDPDEHFARVLANLVETGEHEDQIEVRGRVLCTHDVLIDGELIISTQKDMTDRIKIEREIAYLASHDTMTGLANRASFEAQLAQTISMNSHSSGHFSVLMADLDRFKQINDTYGHPAGDEVLKEIACRFRASLGHNDFVARLGGDEFVFLCRGDDHTTRALASRLAASGAQPIQYDGTSLSVGVSVGYATFPAHGRDQESLLRAADHALYQAKTVGHGIVQHYHPPEEAAYVSAVTSDAGRQAFCSRTEKQRKSGQQHKGGKGEDQCQHPAHDGQRKNGADQTNGHAQQAHRHAEQRHQHRKPEGKAHRHGHKADEDFQHSHHGLSCPVEVVLEE